MARERRVFDGLLLTVLPGAKYASNTDLFMVTLQKSEKDYSPTTRYLDRAISVSRSSSDRKPIPAS